MREMEPQEQVLAKWDLEIWSVFLLVINRQP